MKTMKIMRRLMGCAAAILALSACSESEDLLSAFHSDPNAVRITAQVGKASADGFTRSNPLGTAEEQANFNVNDEISVQADGQDAVTYKYDGKEWQPQGNKFLKWEKETMNFTAYYPATFNGTINQPTEYNSLKSLADADFMSFSGSKTNTNNSNQLSLTMERKMARVIVEIASFNDQYTTNATVNSLSICGVKAYKHSDGKFYALIKPCTESSATFISLDVAEGESKTTTEKLTGIPTLEAGNSYTYKLTVGKNKISVSGISVANWNTGTITDNGKAEQIIRYVTFTADAEQTFKMITKGNYAITGLQYSVDNGKWQNVEKDIPVTFGGTNGNLRLRGTNINGTASKWTAYSTITFTDPTVNVACTGDIRTLLDWRNYSTVNTQNARFCYLFNGCTVLTSAPELPAKELADNCYNSMFQGCTSLTAAPELKATTLALSCYESMFFGCTSLTSALELPATKLAYKCYYGMFESCTSLESAPELKATTLVASCYESMFSGCTSLEKAPELKATTLADYCYNGMFLGCTKLSTVTMLAPSDKISEATDCCYNWLYNAGTDKTVTSRTLKVMDADAYTALESNLPDIWKKGTAGTKVLNKDNAEIK